MPVPADRVLLLAFLAPAVLFAADHAYGHGLGSVESEVLKINDSYMKVKIETNPDVLHGNETQVDFRVAAVNDDTQDPVSNVLYGIEILDGPDGEKLVSFEAFSSEDALSVTIVPSRDVDIAGDRGRGGVWMSSGAKPLRVEAPVFQQGGLVQVNVEIISIDSVVVDDRERTFENLLTIGEYIGFTIRHGSQSHDLMFATYFDEITEFGYDEKAEKLTAVMPFDWDREFVARIPFVHAEYYIPKSLAAFAEREILMYVNGMPLLGTIDRSGPEEIVVHFLIPVKKLEKLADQMPPELSGQIEFAIKTGKKRDVQKEDARLEDGDRAIALSSKEDWKFHLLLEPAGRINPGTDVKLRIEFHDPITNSIIQLVTYDLDVFLNGRLVESGRALETPDGIDTVTVTFDSAGAAVARISNVNNFDTSGEFSFRVTEPADTDATVSYTTVTIAEGSSVPGCQQDGSCYTPSRLDVAQGGAVVWKNADSVAHTVTSGAPADGPSGAFDSGLLAGGKAFSHVFGDSGSDYYCTLHPWMTGSVSVSSPIPSWVRNNAGWWSDGAIGDGEFVRAIQYLIQQGIIAV